MTDRVARRYCGLCTFAVRAGETVVDDSDDSVEGDTLEYDPSTWVLRDIRVFHSVCYNYVGGVSPQLRALTQCDWTPTQDALADTQHGRLDMWKTLVKPPYRLPPELGHYVADHLVPYYHAAATAALKVDDRRVMRIDLSRNVWACFVKVHGTFYISTLSNTKELDASQTRVLLYDATTPRPAHVVYVARDPWGVRKVIFARRDEVVEVPERADIWWDTIKLLPEKRCLDGHSDGLKLRQLTCEGKPENGVSWPTPRQPNVSFVPYRIPGKSGPIRLAQFRINEAGTVGYYACLDGDTVAFRTQQAGFAAPRSAVTRRNWLYMPLSSGDWIREVWLRGHVLPHGRTETAFIFVLNSGHVCVMGEHVRPQWECKYWYVLLSASHKREVISLYLDFTAGLGAVAAPSGPGESCKAQWAGPSQQTAPSSPYPHSLPFEKFYYAKASLEDVSAVATCRQADIDGQVITGIVLYYTDGTEASLGWVAPNGLDSPAPLPDSGIWLCVSLSRTGFPRVTSIAFAAPAPKDDCYLRLQWCGELEWWFSPRQCQLYYDGKATVATKP